MPSPVGTLLLVEDDEPTQSVMKTVLRLSGFEVTTAANGREALDRLRAEPKPGLILLDLMMPGMDGWQFRRRQRQDPGLADIPVVLVSATNDLHEQCQALGADAYLQKPVVFSEMLDLLKRYERAASAPIKRPCTDSGR
jgi:CheY-like chemotaxis protein